MSMVVPALNATAIFEFGENVQVSVMQTVETTAAEISAKVGVVVPADVILEASGLLVSLALLLLWCGCCAARRAGARRRAREKRMVVEMAENAPEDDGDEHELEKHSHARGPAPGDSDLDEDLYTSKAHAPASAASR